MGIAELLEKFRKVHTSRSASYWGSLGSADEFEVDTLKEVLEFLEASLPIPVTERLPTKSDGPHQTIGYEEVSVLAISVDRIHWDVATYQINHEPDDTGWYFPVDAMSVSNEPVTHWLPLPPKPE
jgi:hypothetical protein